VDAVALRSLEDRKDVFYPTQFVMTNLKPIGHHVRNTLWLVPSLFSETNLSDHRLNRILLKSHREEGQAAQWTQFFLSIGPSGTMHGKVLCSAVQSRMDLSGHRLICLLFINYSEGEERAYPMYF
jgi:hypothetical protein